MQGIQEKIERFGQNAEGQAEKLAAKAKDASSGVLGAAKETFQDATCGAADMANKAAGHVRDAAKEWLGSAEDVAMCAAKTVQHAASGAAAKVGDWGEDVASIIRRNPIPAAVVALGLGYLAAIACRRDSSS